MPGRQWQRHHHGHGQQQLSRVGEGANEVDGAEHERDHPERCVRGPALLR